MEEKIKFKMILILLLFVFAQCSSTEKKIELNLNWMNLDTRKMADDVRFPKSITLDLDMEFSQHPNITEIVCLANNVLGIKLKDGSRIELDKDMPYLEYIHYGDIQKFLDQVTRKDQEQNLAEIDYTIDYPLQVGYSWEGPCTKPKDPETNENRNGEKIDLHLTFYKDEGCSEAGVPEEYTANKIGGEIILGQTKIERKEMDEFTTYVNEMFTIEDGEYGDIHDTLLWHTDRVIPMIFRLDKSNSENCVNLNAQIKSVYGKDLEEILKLMKEIALEDPEEDPESAYMMKVWKSFPKGVNVKLSFRADNGEDDNRDDSNGGDYNKDDDNEDGMENELETGKNTDQRKY